MGEGLSAQDAVLACDLVFDLVIDSRRGAESLDGLLGDAEIRRDDFEQLWVMVPDPDKAAEPGRAALREAKTGRAQAAPRRVVECQVADRPGGDRRVPRQVIVSTSNTCATLVTSLGCH